MYTIIPPHICRIYVLLYPCYYPHLTVICTYRKGKQGKNKGEHTMNDKTREQIEAMKNQTIGVEIEMNNITREKAARKVAEYFGTRAWNAASEYGYYSWACKDQQGQGLEIPEGCEHLRTGRRKMRTGHPQSSPTTTSKPCRKSFGCSARQEQRAAQAADAGSTSTSARATTPQRPSATL